MNVWKRLERPVLSLAPMEGVTDSAFRRVVAQCGAPDVFFTEFVNVEGMYSDGAELVRQRLVVSDDEAEHPLVAQIWGANPENFERAADELAESGLYAGVDINFGCPDKAVIKKGLCSALVNNRSLAKEMIAATKKGAGGRVPVSVKIRIGFDKAVTEDWVRFLLEQGIDVLTVHGRTTKELSNVANDWREIEKAVAVRDAMGAETLIIGNGDVDSYAEAEMRTREHGVDGVMIGRGIFKDPWIFNKGESMSEKSVEEKLAVLLTHVFIWEEIWSKDGVYIKNFAELRRFFKIYTKGFAHSSTLRAELMSAENGDAVREMVRNFLSF